MFPVKASWHCNLVETSLIYHIQVFGELEYVFGCFKIIFIVMLIMLMLILGIMKRKYKPLTNVMSR